MITEDYSIELTLELLERSGGVAIPLIACAIAIGYSLTYRFWIVSTTHASLPRIQQEIDRCVKHYVSGLQSTFHSNESVQHQSVNDAMSLARHELEFVRSLYQQEMITLKLHMNELRTLLHVVVAISPLLGLLGTVSGMISTFDSLGDTLSLIHI